jgi:pilus assembly protein CpaB
MTQTVLADVRVIAVDQEIVQGASPTAGVTGRLARTVTLEVSGNDAERLSVAQGLGRISLAIRAADNSATPRPAGGGVVYASDVAPNLAGPALAGNGHNVSVIQGDQRTEVHFP